MASSKRGQENQQHPTTQMAVSMTTRRPSIKRSDRIPSLDGLRAISILLVIASHATERAPSLLGQLWRIDAGGLGVRVFFVISGYLITTLLLQELGKYGQINLKRFYIRRTLRIMPAFYAYLAIVSMLKWIGLEHALSADLKWSHVAHAATYTTNYLSTSWLVGHSWSLSVEEQFYLLWPGVLALFDIRTAMKIALAILVISPICRGFAQTLTAWPDNPRYAFESVADALASGCLLGYMRNSQYRVNCYEKLLASRLASAWPVYVLVVSAVSVRWPLLGLSIGISALNLTIAFGVDHSLRFTDSLFARLLNTASLSFIGTLSYSLYLWQQPFFSAGLIWPTGQLLLAIIVCALVSYFVVERAGLVLRSRLADRMRNATVA